MPDDRAYGFNRRHLLLVVVIAATAFVAGRYSSLHGDALQLLQRQNSLKKDVRLASSRTGAARSRDDSSDGQWCWVKVKCEGSAALQPSGLDRTGVAAAVNQASAPGQQQTASGARGTDRQQLSQPAVPEASRAPEPEAAEAPQGARPASATQEASLKGVLDKQDAEQRPVMDVVGLAVKPTCINRAAVEGLLTHVRPRAVHVVTSTARQCVAFRSWGAAVNCHTQDALVPGLTKASVQQGLAERFGVDSDEQLKGRTMAGWYLQQFLKLGAAGALPGLSEYFLIWDMDMVPLRPLPLLTPPSDAAAAASMGGSAYQTLVNIGGASDWLAGYNATYMALFGRPLALAPDGSSLVTHMLVVYKPFMAAMLANIAKATAPAPPGAWISRILDALPKDNLDAGFSEYATYLSWVRERHPGSQRLAGSVTWSRFGPGGWDAVAAAAKDAPGGLCCPTPQQLQEAQEQGLEYCGWDVGHVPQCHYSDARYAEAYGVELPPVRRRQRRRQW